MTTASRDYKGQVAKEVGPPQTGPDYERHSGVYFFLSLDLVNSTAYKAKNPDWKYKIRMFYDEAKNFWRNHRGTFRPRVWKYAGDEVLFYSRIRSVTELQAAVEASYTAMRHVSATVQKWSEHSFPPLFVKGTCWAAFAQYQAPAPEHDLPTADSPTTRNIVFQSPLGSDVAGTFFDFLGPEIDAGFRITSGSVKKALVVSAEVAHLLWTRGERAHGNRLRIVGFRELKGVWDGRHYPLVWYRENWTDDALNEDYEYDDRFRFEVLSKAYEAEATSMDQVDSILTQVNRRWFDGILPKDPDPSDLGDEDPAAILAAASIEVHCVAVCFSDDGKVLIAQRSETKEVFPGHWEVGCGQLRPGEDFSKALQRDYLADFNLQLELEPFQKMGLGAIGSYAFEKRGNVVPGAIFVARVRDPSRLRPAKHAKAEWVAPDALPADIQSRGVPDLVTRIRRAHDVWKAAKEAGMLTRPLAANEQTTPT